MLDYYHTKEMYDVNQWFGHCNSCNQLKILKNKSNQLVE